MTWRYDMRRRCIHLVTVLTVAAHAACSGKLNYNNQVGSRMRASTTQSEFSAVVLPASKLFDASFEANISVTGELKNFSSLRYSLDGSEVSCKTGTIVQGTAVSIPIAKKLITVKAVACDSQDRSSPVASAEYTFELKSSHQGWTDIKSIGRATNYLNDVLKPLEVKFAWVAQKLNDDTSVGGYRIYRSENQADRGSPLTEVASTQLNYHDSTAEQQKTYYYQVVAVKDGKEIPTTGPLAQLKIYAAPDNMALVHRWMANLEICSLRGVDVDPSRHNSCVYNGPASTNGFLDIGYSYLVDINLMGCNYTPPPACSDSIFGCLGNGAPNNGVGNIGDVYFSRSTVRCYVKKTHSTWEETLGTGWNGATGRSRSAAELQAMFSNKGHLPPVRGYFHFQDIQAGCALQTAGGIPKRLLSHREFIAASAWEPSLTQSQLDVIHEGKNLPVTGGCNRDSDDGLTYSDTIDTADPDTRYMPANPSTQRFYPRTYSNATFNCVSRYGIRDMIGGPFEVTSDQVLCNHTSQTCVGIASTLVPANKDFENLNLTDLMGPLVNAGNYYNSGWALKTDYVTKNANRFLLPLGIPVHQSSTTTHAVTIGTGAKEFNPLWFAGSHSISDATGSWGTFSDSDPRTVTSGGGGRFTFNIRHHGGEVWDSFRCAATLPE